MDPGGIETWLMNVLRNIDRTKVQFDFAVHTEKKGFYDDEIEELGGKFIRIPQFRLFNIHRYRKAWENILKQHGYTILHTHVRSTAPIYLKIAKKYGITTIAHSHNTSNGKFPIAFVKTFLQQKIAGYSDIRLACSDAAGKWLFRKHVFDIIKNGIDLSLYVQNDGARAEYRKAYHVADVDILLGHIGRFSYQKNHFFLLDVFSQMYKKNKAFKLVLVGDGELKNDIKKKIQELGLSDSVILTGVRSDIPSLLQMMDGFVFPSLYEGLGIVLIEAQTAGLRCFMSDIIPSEVMLTENVYPISLKKGSEYWADFIMKNVGSRKKDNLQAIKDAGFDIKAVAKNLEKLYCDISIH